MSLRLIEGLRAQAQKLEKSIPLAVASIVKDNEAYIIDLNIQEQLYNRGLNTLGVELSDYAPYSDITISIKRSKGQPTNRVTLRDTQDFHNSFELILGSDAFEITATDEKTKSLINKYGRNILGLTDQNIVTLIWDYVYPDLLTAAKKILHGS